MPCHSSCIQDQSAQGGYILHMHCYTALQCHKDVQMDTSNTICPVMRRRFMLLGFAATSASIATTYGLL